MLGVSIAYIIRRIITGIIRGCYCQFIQGHYYRYHLGIIAGIIRGIITGIAWCIITGIISGIIMGIDWGYYCRYH